MIEDTLQRIEHRVTQKRTLVIITCIVAILCMLTITTMVTIAEWEKIQTFSYHMETLEKQTKTNGGRTCSK